MELKDALLARRSVRKFTQAVPTEEEVSELLHAAMSAPSACNRTPWEFYVVTDPEKLLKLQDCSHYSRITAPMAIIVCGNLEKALPLHMAPFWVQDASAATENILLRAVDLGLGACWCGVHPQKRPEERVAKLLGIPEAHIPLNIIYVGYPAESHEPRDQYCEEKVHWVR